jgi:hypothetical protein
VVFVVYKANGREIGGGDTLPARMLPIAILRGDGPFLDRFRQHLVGPVTGGPDVESGLRIGVYHKDPGTDSVLPYWLAFRGGHLVSTYPVGAALLAVPFYLPQVLYLDWRHPGWDTNTASLARYSSRMAKNAAAGLGALTVVALFHLLRRLGLARVALPTACGVALGSNLWQDSQSLWQQVPVALALTLSLALLVPAPVSRPRLFLAGLTTAALVWCRPGPQDVLLAGVIFLWVAWHQPRGLAWFLPAPALLAGALLGYNLWLFGTAGGGYSSGLGPDYFTYNPRGVLKGLAGQLVSPRRGLFVYCPWVALALAVLPAAAPRLRPGSLVCWLLGALLLYPLPIFALRHWWCGAFFGPRFFTDAIPLFTIVLALGLSWSLARCPPVFLVFALALAFSANVQFLGAFYYPSSWATTPVNIDDLTPAAYQVNAKRVWDWRDNELTRCVREGPYLQRSPDAPYWLTGFAEGPRPRPGGPRRPTGW